MVLVEAMTASIGLMLGLAGVYLLSFRPLDKRAALLGLGYLGGALYFGALFAFPGTRLPNAWISYGLTLAYFGFFALFPSRLRFRGLEALPLVMMAVWTVAAPIWILSGRHVDFRGPKDIWDILFAPGVLGAGFVQDVILLLRFASIKDRSDPRNAGTLLILVAHQTHSFVLGGSSAVQVLGALFGVGSHPSWLYVPTALVVLLGFSVSYWVMPTIISAWAFLKWRWHTPWLILAAGSLTYVPALLAPLDPLGFAWVRTWGHVLSPALVMYAIARYAPFPGEPTAVRPTLLVTILAGVITYVFAFGAAVLILAEPIAAFAAPLLALAAAIGIAALAMPRARRAQLRRMLATADAPEPRGLQPGDLVMSRYRVERLLAEGGQGRVFEATDRDTGRRVVLKTLPSDAAAAEARHLGKFAHPNIVRFVEVVEVTGRTLLVMEHAPGGDLRAHLSRRGGKLPLAEATRLMDGILAGLAEAHARGIAHRDVKPENVLLDAEGAPKLADFGAAREARPDSTMRAGSLGTLAYLAPEQVRGEPGDARADVYAAGVLFHELLTGERPIATEGRDDFLVRRAILNEAPTLALPPEAARLAPLLTRALAKDPQARFADARAMREALGAGDARAASVASAQP